MKIEFLENGSEDCPLIRIFGTDRNGFGPLYSASLDLADGKKSQCAVHEFPGFVSVNNCTLTMIASDKGAGDCRIDQTFEFTWTLTPEWWVDVAWFIKPFAFRPRDGSFQWLAGEEASIGLEQGSIAVLISCSDDGSW